MYLFIYRQPLWRIVFVMLLAIGLWSLGETYTQGRERRRRAWRWGNGVLVLVSIAAVLFATVIGRESGTREVYLAPFHLLQAAREQPEHYRAMLMNAFLFLPLGLSFSALMPGRRWLRIVLTVLTGLTLSIGVEWWQYRYGLGTCETDDVLCNGFGAALGALHVYLAPKIETILRRHGLWN